MAKKLPSDYQYGAVHLRFKPDYYKKLLSYVKKKGFDKISTWLKFIISKEVPPGKL
jgi:hypothetical protein